MKMLKKLAIATTIVLTIIFMIYGLYSKVFADYGIYGYQILNSSSNDGRYQWPLEIGVKDYVLHVNWACYTFNNIYCIQKGYAYQHDGFNIRYGIWINGNNAILYKNGWEESNIVARWSCEENNIMAGIVYNGNGWTTGLQVDGDMKSGSPSVAQTGVHQYWDTFEAAMNKGTGQNFDFGFSSYSSTGSYCVDAVKQNIKNNGTAYRALMVIMENTKGYNNRQNLIGVNPQPPGTVVEYTNVTVTKEWNDNNNSYGTRPSSIKVDLYRDGEYLKSATLDSSNNWTYTFEELEKNYKYDVKEDTSGLTSYESEKVAESTTSYKFVNTLQTEVKVAKEWDDKNDLDEYRPTTLKVTLYSNGVSTGKTVTLNAENNWTASFGKLDKYDKNGKEINYTVQEETVEKYEKPEYSKSEDSKGNITWTIKNTYTPYYDGYIEISGKVWVDSPDGKGNDINGVYEKDKDVLKEGITVRLKYIDENGTHRLFNENLPSVYETKTDSNGEYKIVVNYDNSENVYKLYEDVTTVNKKLETAYVEFEYDGMKYTTVNDEITTKKVINSDGSESTVNVPSSEQSKAVENETARNNFDSKHSTVTSQTTHPDNWTDKGITATTKTVISYENDKKDENREVVVKYCNGNGTCDRTNPEGAWMIIKGQQNKYPCENCNGTGHDSGTYNITVQKIQNINLGLFEREQPDVAIFEDLSKVEVTMNGQKYTYLYGVKGSDNNDVGLQVKFQNKETYTYRRPVNPADIAYLQEEANKNAMSVLVTYEVKVANLSTTLPITVHNIINSFDSEYILNTSGWTVTDAAGFKQAISGDLNIIVNPQEESEAIELTYTVSIDAIRNLLNQEATLNNAVEIGSYSVRYGEDTLYAEQRSGGRTGKPYAGYDYDSHPGNAGIVLNTTTNRLESTNLVKYTLEDGSTKLVPEDDTDIAPSFVLCQDDEPKTLSGTIWEDVDEDSTDEERLGNGKYDSDEAKASNVKVELYNLDGTIAKLYNKETKQLDRDAVTQTVDGVYSLDGVVTGEYYMKFTYGDDTTKLGHEATTMDGGTTTVNARNYKSTIIKDATIRNILSKDYEDFTEEEKKWHITHEDGFSVAVDNLEERLKIEDLYYGNFSTPLNMIAYTKPFATQVEFEATGSSNVDSSGNIAGVTEKLNKLDFGISERAREDLFAQKTITYLKVTLANGQILTEGNPNDNISYVKSMGLSQNVNSGEEARNALEKQLLVEMDSELIQGAQLQLKYEVEITNNNELDYDYGVYNDYKSEFEDTSKKEYDRYITKNVKANYYYYGESSGLNPMQSVIEIADYIDKDLVYNEDSTKWANMESDALITDAVKEAINNNGYKALQGLKDSSTTITLPRGDTYVQDMTATKLLANQEDNVYDNNVEILKIDGKTARTIQESDNGVQIEKSYKPGNYEPSLDAGTFEQDDDRVKIIITPPTGIINYITIYVIAGLVGLIAISAGVIFIKKKVLTK